MAELRWNPLIKDWVIIASNRQNRPQMPEDWCPFCPGSDNIPDEYDVMMYENDFPALSQNPPTPDDVATDFFKVKDAYGKCEVILYSSNHTATLPELSTEHITRLVDLWCNRYEEISADEKIKYVFIFENRGEVVGVTMPHPHGQIYGYSVIPKKIELELDSVKEYYKENSRCLFCDLLKNEQESGKRIIFSNEHFTVFIPFFSEYPYGIYIMSNSHKTNITQFDNEERASLAQTLKYATGMLDSLFDYKFPYMMCMHNAPVNIIDDESNCIDNCCHFHIAFYPPMRSKDKQKFNASSETGVWAHCNTTAPEQTAEELRAAYDKFLSSL